MTNSQIAVAFIKAQQEMGSAIKDSKNPFFKSSYADLNAVREACIPSLNKHGIAVLQPTVQLDGKSFVKTILLHESGETIESLTEIIFGKSNDAQAQGSGITYARRYGLQSLVCIGAEDDDGNKASERPKTSKKLGDAAEEDMKEILYKKNEDDFKALKQIIENCGGEDELKEIWLDKQNAKTLNQLRKYRPELYSLLEETKDMMKHVFLRSSIIQAEL